MVVRKSKGGYALYSKKGRKLSKTYKKKDSPALRKRKRQVEYFKRKK